MKGLLQRFHVFPMPLAVYDTGQINSIKTTRFSGRGLTVSRLLKQEPFQCFTHMHNYYIHSCIQALCNALQSYSRREREEIYMAPAKDENSLYAQFNDFKINQVKRESIT